MGVWECCRWSAGLVVGGCDAALRFACSVAVDFYFMRLAFAERPAILVLARASALQGDNGRVVRLVLPTDAEPVMAHAAPPRPSNPAGARGSARCVRRAPHTPSKRFAACVPEIWPEVRLPKKRRGGTRTPDRILVVRGCY